MEELNPDERDLASQSDPHPIRKTQSLEARHFFSVSLSRRGKLHWSKKFINTWDWFRYTPLFPSLVFRVSCTINGP